MNKTNTQLLGYHCFSWMCLIEVHRDTCGQYFALCTADMVDLSRISYQYPIYCSSLDTYLHRTSCGIVDKRRKLRNDSIRNTLSMDWWSVIVLHTKRDLLSLMLLNLLLRSHGIYEKEREYARGKGGI